MPSFVLRLQPGFRIQITNTSTNPLRPDYQSHVVSNDLPDYTIHTEVTDFPFEPFIVVAIFIYHSGREHGKFFFRICRQDIATSTPGDITFTLEPATGSSFSTVRVVDNYPA